MGITSKKQNELPHELPLPSHKETEREFDTIPAFDNSVREPSSGVAVPSPQAVAEIKEFMNVNKQ